MNLPFRRRRIVDPIFRGSGIVAEWTIPSDPRATDDVDALARHFKRLSQLEPKALEELISSRLGRLLFGVLRMRGPKPTIDMLGDFDDLVEATPGPMSDEEYDAWLFEGSPMLRQVFQRMKGK